VDELKVGDRLTRARLRVCAADAVSLLSTPVCILLQVLKERRWERLEVPSSVRALVLVNLQSYGGGRNIWGPTTSEKSKQKHKWDDPKPYDGCLEVRGECTSAAPLMVLQHHVYTALCCAPKGLVQLARGH